MNNGWSVIILSLHFKFQSFLFLFLLSFQSFLSEYIQLWFRLAFHLFIIIFLSWPLIISLFMPIFSISISIFRSWSWSFSEFILTMMILMIMMMAVSMMFFYLNNLTYCMTITFFYWNQILNFSWFHFRLDITLFFRIPWTFLTAIRICT